MTASNNNQMENISDEQALIILQQLLATKLKIGMGYIPNPETGILTHQVLLIKVGELALESAPELLNVPFMPVVPSKETAH